MDPATALAAAPPPSSSAVPPSSQPQPGRGFRRPLSLSRSLSSSSRSPAILSPNTGKPCLVCFDREREGVLCELGHFICRGCLQGFIQNFEPLQIRRSGGCISCPGMSPDGQEPCDAAPWCFEDVCEMLDPKTQRVFVSRLQGLLASVLSSASLQHGPSMDIMATSRGHHHRRRSSQRRWSLGRASTRGLSLATSMTMDGGGVLLPEEEATEAAGVHEQEREEEQEQEELRWHRQQIAEGLTLTCPREGCHRAFLDFDGCFALTCPGCGCGFCAACLLDCGDDAHEHCRRVHHGYFGTLAAFNEAQRARRLALVVAYLRSLLCPNSLASPASPVVTFARPPEQAAALVEALLTGPLANDLRDVGIDVEDVRRALADAKGGSSDAIAAATAAGAAPKFFGADGAGVAPPPPVPPPVIRLHYSHAAAHQRYCRWLLDGPGYPPADDALARWMGTALTASSMVAGVWWLTAPVGRAEEEGIGRAVPLVLAALVAGPAGVLLGTGRWRQVLQALYVTLLAGVVCTLLHFWGGQLVSWSLFAIVKVLTVTIHALGFAIDASSYGLRILRGDARGHIDLVPFAPCLSQLKDLTLGLVARGLHAFDVVGLLPPADTIPTAAA